jgi:hypothetical protein
MKPSAVATAALLCLSRLAPARGAATTPIGKVLEMLTALEAKVIKEGEESHKLFAEFSEWCEDKSKNLAYDIKTGEAEVADLKATIEKEAATTAALNTKVEELAAELATDEADLKAATEIRTKEQSDFAAEEAELSDVVGTLERAIGILEKEMAKGAGASMLQLAGEGGVVGALRAMVQASLLSTADEQKLAALVQGSQQARQNEDDEELGAPDADVYQGHSGGIIDVLDDLLDKAKSQLDSLRKEEISSKNNFETLKQSLTDEIKFGNTDLSDAKKGIAQSAQAKATAEGDLQVTSKDLAEDKAVKGDLKANCLLKAQDFEAETKSRGEELKALGEAKKVIAESTSGADKISYGGAASFLQVDNLRQLSGVLAGARLQTSADLAHYEAVRFVRTMSEKQNSTALAQLAMRMASVIRISTANNEDPFAKVKGLISDMIERLESEASADAEHKAYCDKELAESEEKQADKKAEIEKLSTKIDQATARSEELKTQVASLQAGLAQLAKEQSEMDKLRAEERALYKTSKADMTQGLEGVKLALKILNDYYAKDGAAHAVAEGAGASVIGLLEVVESDFSKDLANIEATETQAQSMFDTTTKENSVEKTTKEQDVKYKTKEYTGLDKALSEMTSDRKGVQTELDAVEAYLKQIHNQCDEKAEPYAESKRRREEEIAGLKQALEILEGEAVLLQEGHLRGVRPHRD